MDENRDGLQKEEYQVIQEEIVPRKKNKWRRWGKSLLRIGAYAVVFGVVAGTTLVLTGNFLIKKLGLESTLRQVVGIGTATQSPGATKVPTITSGPTQAVDIGETGTPTPPDFIAATPKATPEVIIKIEDDKTEKPTAGAVQDGSVQGFLNMYTEIADLAGNMKKSLVQVTAITEGVDWFEEAYETVGTASGLYVGDNGLDMLFLVNLDSIEGSTKFEVTFANGETLPCSIFSYDTNYRLAVLSIRIEAVSGMEKDELPVKARFALGDVAVGTPVMVLGNPNGHVGAMELGMVTGASQVVQVIDDEVQYFTTGITEYADGDGFVFNLEGEVIGIVSDSLDKGEQGIITAAAVSGMWETIESTLNNIPRIYCGMRLESVDSVLGGKYKLPVGIYVTEVLPGSPAMYAGVKNGDIITTVGITPVTGVRQFYKEICEVGAQSVRILVSRETKGARKEQTLFIVPETRLH